MINQFRNGTSQAQRFHKALNPGYVSVDERTTRDWMLFVKAYAKEIKFYNLENQVEGNWSKLLTEDVDAILAYLKNPEIFEYNQSQLNSLSRPHQALFLSFLLLLKHVRHQLNALTKKHLDFYFTEALQMEKKQAVPDQVNILVELKNDLDQYLLKAGTALNAGKDSLGKNLIYKTDSDLVVNQGKVSQLRSILIDKVLIGIREAHQNFRLTDDERFIEMMAMVYGQPGPGDAVPKYKDGTEFGIPLFVKLKLKVDFIHITNGLAMTIPELKEIFAIKEIRESKLRSDWTTLKNIFRAAGRKKRNNNSYKPTDTNPQDFDLKLKEAIGDIPFNEISGFDTLDDLYRNLDNQNVEDFIVTRMFMHIKEFRLMMEIKNQADNDWERINTILETAGRIKKDDPGFNLNPSKPWDFDANLQTALGAPSYPGATGTIDKFYSSLLDIEAFFCMALKDFYFILKTKNKPEASPKEWEKVYKSLEKAYEEKLILQRRNTLRNKIKSAPDTNLGFEDMLSHALGDRFSGDKLPPYTKSREQIIKELARGKNKEAHLEYIQNELFLSESDFKTVMAQKGKSKSNSGWEAVYIILELAQRKKQQIEDKPPLKIEWHNIYAAEDATTNEVTTGIPEDKDTPRWRTFGSPDQSNVNSHIGWAIASPLLNLRDGTRTITIYLGFREDSIQNIVLKDHLDPLPFSFFLSGEKGPVEVFPEEIKGSSEFGTSDLEKAYKHALRIKLKLNPDDPAVAPEEDSAFSSDHPMLRVLLRNIEHESKGMIRDYMGFKDLVLEKIHLQVDVEGITEFTLRNESKVLKPKKPFKIFGEFPRTGSSFMFSHPELASKVIDNLDIKFEWLGAPKLFKSHYNLYEETPPSNTNFTFSINIFDKNLVKTAGSGKKLFNKSDGAAINPVSVEVKKTLDAIAGFSYVKRQLPEEKDDVLEWNRYFVLELESRDFYHIPYPKLVAKKAMEFAKDLAVFNKSGGTEPDPDSYSLNAPYTPEIKSLTIGYSSSTEIEMKHYQRAAEDTIFHIEPFGYRDITFSAEESLGNFNFLPQFNEAGDLYVGIEKLNSGQTISLLFQMAEGSANPDVKRGLVSWSTLSDNLWVSLDEGNLQSDTTNGLINSGITLFEIPSETSINNTILPSGMHWIRARIDRNTSSVCDTIAVLAQAVGVTFDNNNNAPDHLSAPLPSETIKGLVRNTIEVKKIAQPYTSWNGKIAELDNIFYTRISERLRHKNRAITIWDYERMVLENFPEIYKIKCLPAGVAEDLENEPGKVDLVVIPDIRGKLPFNPFEPKVSSSTILKIENYIRDFVPHYAKVKVKNPRYEHVKVRFNVRFSVEGNEDFYITRLNEAIKKFLAPWAYEDGADITFGGRIYGNVIINFIEEQDYVDYIAGIKLFRSFDGENFDLVPPIAEGNLIEASSQDVIFVSAKDHDIDLIVDQTFEEEIFTGINYFRIELDFKVGPTE